MVKSNNLSYLSYQKFALPPHVFDGAGNANIRDHAPALPLKSENVHDVLFTKFASNWRTLGYLPEQVRLDGKETFVTHIQYDHNKMVERKNRAYARKIGAFDVLSQQEVIEISEDARDYIKRNPPSWFYVPASEPFGVHEFVKLLQERYDGVIRAPNQHLIIEGKDFKTVVKKAFPYLSHDFVARCLHILGANIKYRLSFAQMLFARIKNETVEKSPCSKPCLVIIFGVNMVRINLSLVMIIWLGLVRLPDNQPDILPDRLKREPEPLPSTGDYDDENDLMLESVSNLNYYERGCSQKGSFLTRDTMPILQDKHYMAK